LVIVLHLSSENRLATLAVSIGRYEMPHGCTRSAKVGSIQVVSIVHVIGSYSRMMSRVLVKHLAYQFELPQPKLMAEVLRIFLLLLISSWIAIVSHSLRERILWRN